MSQIIEFKLGDAELAIAEKLVEAVANLPFSQVAEARVQHIHRLEKSVREERDRAEEYRIKLNEALSSGGGDLEKQFEKAEALLAEVQRGLTSASPLKRQIREYFGEQGRGELIQQMRSR
jgi:hypothetical protein